MSHLASRRDIAQRGQRSGQSQTRQINRDLGVGMNGQLVEEPEQLGVPLLALPQERDAESEGELETGFRVLEEHAGRGIVALLSDLAEIPLVRDLIEEALGQIVNRGPLGVWLRGQLQPAGLVDDRLGEKMPRHDRFAPVTSDE